MNIYNIWGIVFLCLGLIFLGLFVYYRLALYKITIKKDHTPKIKKNPAKDKKIDTSNYFKDSNFSNIETALLNNIPNILADNSADTDTVILQKEPVSPLFTDFTIIKRELI